MDIYKEYLYQMSKIEYQSPYLIVSQYPPPLLRRYIPRILKLKHHEETSFLYYGELKQICLDFVSFYSECIDTAIKKHDIYSRTKSGTALIELFIETVELVEDNHQKVLQEFQPINSDQEQEYFDEIISLHNNYMNKLSELRNKLSKFYLVEDIVAFAENHFDICLERFHEMGDFTFEYTSRIIADRLQFVEISLSSIVKRIKKCAEKLDQKFNRGLTELFENMYEVNNEYKHMNRTLVGISCREATEIIHKIEKIRMKIKLFGDAELMDRINAELDYWSNRMRDLEEVVTVVTKVRKALERANEEKRIHNLYKRESGAGKKTCWDIVMKNFKQNIKDLQKKYIEACLPIQTLLSSSLYHHINYKDEVGKFFIDEYGHKNYLTQYDTKAYHMQCDGVFKENRDFEYYYDHQGRYIIENGMKLYQNAPCCQKFKLNNQELLEIPSSCACLNKCGHLTEPCQFSPLSVKDIMEAEPVNIENTLDKESVQYLWDKFGYILPEILNEAFEKVSKNPTHFVGHLLVTKNFAMTDEEIKTKKKEADEYRNNILQQRKDKSDELFRKFKEKNYKKCKPEDLCMTATEYATTSQQKEQDIYQQGVEL